MNLTIRPANIEDLSTIQNLNNELCKYETTNQFDTYIENFSLNNTTKEYYEYMIREEFVIIAEINNNIIGYLAGSSHKDTTYPYYEGITAELNNIFIQEKYRRLGIGSKMINSFLNWCKEHNAKRIMVSTSVANTNTINFYNKHGFKSLNITLRHEIN